MTGSTQYFSANEGCQPRIPLFPLRYSAHPRPKGGGAYAYEQSGLKLQQGFRKLDHAQYGLRCIGAGFIYLFDETEGDIFVWRVKENDGQFIEMKSRYRSLDSAIKGYIPGHTVRHLWARKCSRVHLLLTDTLLTERKIREIQTNKDGVRDRLATTLDMNTWNPEAPAEHTFAAEHIHEWVEEYKGTDLDFSPWKIKPTLSANALLQSMRAVAPAAQLAVVMQDHIALVQDLGGVFQESRKALEHYTTAPDKTHNNTGATQRYRKKLIADLIGRIYESEYAENAGVAGQGEQALEKKLKRDMDVREQNRQFQASIATQQTGKYRPSSYPLTTPPSLAPADPIAARAEALAASAPIYSRHIKEAERVKFLRDFDNEVTKRHASVLDRKNDRCRWLESYLAASPCDLGAAFMRYDTSDPMSSTSHAIAFIACTEGMIWGTETTPSGKTDKERELFQLWWEMPWQTNPILTNIDHDKGLGDTIWDNKMDVTLDAALSKGAGQLLRYVAVHFLMEQVSVYTLSRFPNTGNGRAWHGAARDAVANRIHQLAGMGTVEDANRLVQMLETRYQDRLTTRSLTPIEAVQALEDAAGFPRGTVAVGSLASNAGDVMEVFEWSRLKPLMRSASPFLQVFERGVAGGVAFFSFLNLKAAVGALTASPNWETVSNFAAALMGVGSALNGVLVTTRALMPQVYLRVSISSMMLERLSRVSALDRWFGYGGALFDALTNWLRATGQRRLGNHDAATAYALAAVGLSLGGAAMTTGGAALASGLGIAGTVATVPVWGWIAAGAILLGVGLWWLLEAERGLFTALNYWLNDGSFGKHELLGRKAITKYVNLDDENKAYVSALYAPRLVGNEWKVFGTEQAPIHLPGRGGVAVNYDPRFVMRIAYPLAGEVKRPAATYESKSSDAPPPKWVEEGPAEPLSSGGSVHTYVVTGLSEKAVTTFTLQTAYKPTLLEESLETNFQISATDAPFYYGK
ncbi:toxin VasX [Pseudomonas sp. R5(2019)]|uniref:toxin VasX n=1 Tax=Pseudomonas sp. R5(2019) TaxID=2697566 RepID=UPI00141268CE|nr:toxin VasX [Pseudomonas sp. R5(2019)]NBA95899.1 hypothetical protein [Pseudomonas sp. R5(2019)]